MKKCINNKGFTLIEILIVITIIGVLAALVAGTLGDLGGRKSRDAIRISDVSQIATMVSSLQNRFHIPPVATGMPTSTKYPNDCKAGNNLGTCLKALHVASSDEELAELLSDPKQGATIGSENKTFQYYYAADTKAFKVCTYLEDQGAFEKLNATSDGTLSNSLDSGDDTAYMHCVTHGNVDGVGTIAEITPPVTP